MKAILTYLAALTLFLLGLVSPVQAGPALIVEGEVVGVCEANAVASPCDLLVDAVVDGEERVVQATMVNANAVAVPPPVFNPNSDGHTFHTYYPTCWDFDAPDYGNCVCNTPTGECDETATDVFCKEGGGDCVRTDTRYNHHTTCGPEGFDFEEEFCLVWTFHSREPLTGGTGGFAGAEGQLHQHGEGEFDPFFSFTFSSSLQGVININNGN